MQNADIFFVWPELGMCMQIKIQCPFCGRSQLRSSELSDRRIRCSECGGLFKVPRLEDMPEATRIAARAKGGVYVDECGKTYG